MTNASVFAKRLRKAAFKKPDITVKTFRPTSVSTRGSTAHVHLELFNPNPYTLDVIHLEYKICEVSARTLVSNRTIAKGTLKEAFSIPPKESMDARMDVTLSFSGIGSASKSFAVGGGRMRYMIVGTLTVKKFLTFIAIPFEKEKEFSLFVTQDSKENVPQKERESSKSIRRVLSFQEAKEVLTQQDSNEAKGKGGGEPQRWRLI